MFRHSHRSELRAGGEPRVHDPLHHCLLDSVAFVATQLQALLVLLLGLGGANGHVDKRTAARPHEDEPQAPLNNNVLFTAAAVTK